MYFLERLIFIAASIIFFSHRCGKRLQTYTGFPRQGPAGSSLRDPGWQRKHLQKLPKILLRIIVNLYTLSMTCFTRTNQFIRRIFCPRYLHTPETAFLTPERL